MSAALNRRQVQLLHLFSQPILHEEVDRSREVDATLIWYMYVNGNISRALSTLAFVSALAHIGMSIVP